MILARTLKGKGVSIMEGKDGWHGKALKLGEETDKAVAELEAQYVALPDGAPPASSARLVSIPAPPPRTSDPSAEDPATQGYAVGQSVATREAFGAVLAALGRTNPLVVALDADVANSTFSEKFEAVAPARFYESFIAEQVMVGAAMGLAARGAIPFPSTFACFLTRAYDFIRMAAISDLNVKLAGSHAGVSIGEDGPSQMALEDLAMVRAQPNFTVLYPCDAVSCEALVLAMAATPGPGYLRLSRPKTPVLYGPDERFPIGGLKVLRQSARDVATVVAAGVTVFEALKAFDTLASQGMPIRVIDLYSVQPIDASALAAAGRATHGHIVTVEDHYAAGGLGDAVAAAVAPSGLTVERLAVREIPRSGKPAELLERYGISASHIVSTVSALAGAARPVGKGSPA
jgi:transketolase